MTRTLTVVGDVNALDTRTALTGQGSVSAPSRLIPQGVKMIKTLIFAASHDGAVDDGSAIWIIRLGGAAVKNGEQAIVVGAAGNQTVQSGSDAAPNVMLPFILNDVDVEVSEGDVINIDAEFAGVDIGDTHVVVTLVFDNGSAV